MATASPRRSGSRQSRPLPPNLPFDGFGPEEFELFTSEKEIEEDSAATASGGAPPVRGRLHRAGSIVRGGIPRLAPRLAWLGLAATLALGSAGVVAATSPVPDSGLRGELTYGNDRQLAPRLDAAQVQLTLLGKDTDSLGEQTRKLLSYLTQVNATSLAATYAAGDKILASIETRSAALSTSLECKPWTPARTDRLKLTYDPSLVDRWQLACAAAGSLEGLDESWKAMVAGSQVVMDIADSISEHDTFATAALQLATQGDYPGALRALDQAKATLTGTKRLAASFTSAGRDVSTLNQWLARIDRMDLALATLWQAMIDSKGKITPEVTAALRTVADADQGLPQTNTILSVVVYELADNLIAEGIAIEQARGQLATALAALAQTTVDI